MLKKKRPDIAIYIRVASIDQTTDAELEKQTEVCRNYIAINLPEYAKDILKIPVFCDRGFSAMDMKREGLKKLTDGIASGNIRSFVTKDISRLHRRIHEGLEFDRFLCDHHAFAILIEGGQVIGYKPRAAILGGEL